jgi:hypothetical protein
VSIKRFFYPFAVFLSRAQTSRVWQFLFPQPEALHKDRFALEHEVSDLSTENLPTDSLLLGVNQFSRILRVKATPKRRELGNILIEAPTGGGGTHLRRDIVIPQWFQASKAAARQ